MAGSNGNRLVRYTSPSGGVLDPITINMRNQFVTNLTSMRQEWFERFQGGDRRRKINDECGYPDVLTIAEYWEMYDRNPIAKRVVQVLPRECWQVSPEVRESEDSHVETAFERAVKDLDSQLQGEGSWFESRGGNNSLFWDTCRRHDESMGIGTLGIVLVGLDDAAREEGGYRGLQDPVQGFIEKNSVPVGKGELGANFEKTPGRWRLTVNEEETQGRKLLYLRPFDESVFTISQFENNPTSRRYGKPTMYLINVNTNYVSRAVGLPIGTYSAHWTRVVPGADNLENSDDFGVSRLHTPWNPLYNIQKILGADGEGFYKNALMRLFFETHPQLGGDVDVDDDALRNMMEEMENGMQRYGRLSGMSAHPVAPVVTDPTPHILANVEQICIMIPVPKRVFMGTERGELASGQDDAAWNDTLRGRQAGHCTVRVAVPLIDRLIAVGVLPRPKRKYTLVWPDLESLSEDAAATVANKWCDAIQKYIAGNLENFMDPLEFSTRILRMGEDEARAMLVGTLKWLEYQKWQQLHLKDIEVTPGDEWPGEVPVGAGEESGVAVGHLQEGEQLPPGMEQGPPGQGGKPNPFSSGGGKMGEEPYNPNAEAAKARDKP